jgi:hypothetical protein
MRQCEDTNEFCGHVECINAYNGILGLCILPAGKILPEGRYLIAFPKGQGRGNLYVSRHVCVDCFNRYREATDEQYAAWLENIIGT